MHGINLVGIISKDLHEIIIGDDIDIHFGLKFMTYEKLGMFVKIWNSSELKVNRNYSIKIIYFVQK